MQTPCAVFATFENEEGYNRAIKFNKQVDEGILPSFFAHLLTDKLEIEEATEPTDIIWENRYFTDSQRRNKKLIVSMIIFVMLMCSGAVIFKLSTKSRILKMKYPITDCKITNAEYIGAKKIATYKTWQKDAFNEYHVNKAFEKK